MKKYFLVFLIIVILAFTAIIFWYNFYLTERPKNISYFLNKQLASQEAAVNSSFEYKFEADETIEETGKMNNSSNSYWWLNSGGLFYSKDGVGKTIQGELAQYSKWRLTYALSSPIDTDNGYHPQNIFRLVSRNKWQNFQQKVYFKINKINISESPNRNGSNGILLLNRYQDGNNLYYVGLRVDGAAVIKKKYKGKYYTLAKKQFYTAGEPYNRDINPNLIPDKQWLGVKSEVKTNNDKSVSVKLFIDKENNGNWTLALEAKDDNKSYGGAAISSKGYAGLRADFMDAEFDDYSIIEL